MCSKPIIFVLCLFAVLSLTGCKVDSDAASLFGSDGLFVSGGSSDGGSSVVAALTSGSGSSGGANPGHPGGPGHTPEPATIALLGSGLFAYALLRRRKRK